MNGSSAWQPVSYEHEPNILKTMVDIKRQIYSVKLRQPQHRVHREEILVEIIEWNIRLGKSRIEMDRSQLVFDLSTPQLNRLCAHSGRPVRKEDCKCDDCTQLQNMWVESQVQYERSVAVIPDMEEVIASLFRLREEIIGGCSI